jgi:hypothetical protein
MDKKYILMKIRKNLKILGIDISDINYEGLENKIKESLEIQITERDHLAAVSNMATRFNIFKTQKTSSAVVRNGMEIEKKMGKN